MSFSAIWLQLTPTLSLLTHTNPAMSDSLETLATLFAPVPDYHSKDKKGNNDDISLNNIIVILDNRHIMDDCVMLDGSYSDFINSCVF